MNCLKLFAVIFLVCHFSWTPGNAAMLPKKSISYGGNSSAITSMGLVTRYYNWTPGKSGTLPAGSEFDPMIWGTKNLNSSGLSTAQTYGTTLMGFNEPDNPGQANMTYQEALTAWPQLQATGMRLGSPAVGFKSDQKSGWLYNFMQGVTQNNYKVDVMCVHYYGEYDNNNTNPQKASDACITCMVNTYNLYKKPIWLTEFALSWGNVCTQAQDLQFMQLVLPRLDSLPFMEAYFWFTLPYNSTYSNMSMANSDGSLNSLGTFYKNFASSTGVLWAGTSAGSESMNVTALTGCGFRIACPWERTDGFFRIVNSRGRTISSSTISNGASVLIDRTTLGAGTFYAIWQGDGKRSITRIVAP
jgi:hypothetical protein